MSENLGGELSAASDPRAIPGLPGLPFSTTLPNAPAHSASGIAPEPSAHLGAEHTEFAAFAHEQVREYIQLADQKAGLVGGASAAMLAFLHTQGISTAWLVPIRQWGLAEALAFVSSFGLSGAIAFAATVVLPRTNADASGLLSWVAIAKRASASEYTRDVLAASSDALRDSYLQHAHELALVCRRKYRWMWWAFLFGSVGFLAAAGRLMLVRGS